MTLHRSLLFKLVLAFVFPTLVLFSVFAFVTLDVTRRDLDAELGNRLSAVASSAATTIRGKYLLELGPGNETDRAYLGTVKKLQAIEAAAKVRLFVIDRDYGLRADTLGTAIGTPQYAAQLDRVELADVFAKGAAIASLSFEGNDGVTYKTGWAPILASEDDRTVMLALGAVAEASYFERLAELRSDLISWGIALAAVVIVATFVVAFLLTRNVRKLAAAAERMRGGDLATKVAVSGKDEIGILGVAMEQMRGALAKRDGELQAMLAGIAHEVRNPLAGMTLYTGILQEELSEDAEKRSHVDKIKKELGYLDRIVNEFLDFARKTPLQLESVDLRELIAEIVPLCGGDKVEVLGDSRVVAMVDRSQLRAALLNLTKNAVQASEANHPVRIMVEKRASEVVIDVTNRGDAIPDEVAAKLFDPFFTTKEKGTGLGLALVRAIALRHGGNASYLRIDDRTCFRLQIPS